MDRIRKRHLVKYLLLLVVLISISSCFRTQTYLNEEEKSWNPYREGQLLVFKSSSGELDSILVKQIGFIFPDGINPPDYNESLRVLVKHTNPRNSSQNRETYFVEIVAESRNFKEPAHIIFEPRLKKSWFFEEKYNFDWLKEQPERRMSVPYGEFRDVIEINDKGRDDPDTELDIKTIYWSKSKGYIMFVKYDLSYWELTDIIEPK